MKNLYKEDGTYYFPILMIDQKGRLRQNDTLLNLDTIAVVTGLWDETLFQTKVLMK